MKFDLNLNGFVNRYILREVKKLYVSFFIILEDLRDDGYINEELYNKLRKRVLDSGNGCIRSLDEQIKEFDFTLKKENN